MGVKDIMTERGVKAGLPVLWDFQPGAPVYRFQCREGHKVHIGTAGLKKRWPCPCGGWAKPEAKRQFHENAGKLGVVLLVQGYHGSQKEHRAICREGHKIGLTPWDAFRALQDNPEDYGFTRRDVCAFCGLYAPPSVFYVVTGPDGVKFGISHGNGAQRLDQHARDGYDTVLRLFTRLEPKVAVDLERDIKTSLGCHFTPVRGREYFETGALPLVLDMVDRELGN